MSKIDWDETEAIQALFEGQAITEVTKIDAQSLRLNLSSGRQVDVDGNVGACCGAYFLEKWAENGTDDNIITAVKVEVTDASYGSGLVYSLFVFTMEDKILLSEFEGDDGTGYYGTGFTLTII